MTQQPKVALVTVSGKEKARKPLDPPPVVQLKLPRTDPRQQFLQSPYLFMKVSLLKPDVDEQLHGDQSLLGSLVSSLHRLKDPKGEDGGFFVFGDISIKVQGVFRLRFSLFDLRPQTQNHCAHVQCLGAIDSDVFHVVASKDFKGMEESTYLSRAFSDQGLRLRLRKEARGMKRGYADDAPSAPSPPKRVRTEPEERHPPAMVAFAAPTYEDTPRMPNLPTISLEHQQLQHQQHHPQQHPQQLPQQVPQHHPQHHPQLPQHHPQHHINNIHNMDPNVSFYYNSNIGSYAHGPHHAFNF